MVLAHQKHSNHGFFQQSTKAYLDVKPSGFVDLGGHGNCGFLALAATLVDRFKQDPLRGNHWLTPLLSAHFKYFPQYKTKLPGVHAPVERMQQLINDVGRMSELLQSLSYTLRQIAVSEMCASPEMYRGAFVSHHEGTSPEMMRQSETWIDESCIAAIAKVLAIPIEVQVVHGAKTVPLSRKYEIQGKISPLLIQLQDNHYTASVSNVRPFVSINAHMLRMPQPNVSHLPQDADWLAIKHRIAAVDKALYLSFEKTSSRLRALVDDEQVSQEALLACYVKQMGTSDYLAGRVKYVGLEHGNQHFFEAITNTQDNTKATMRYESSITEELIHALSRAITIGQMSEDDVFEHLETSQMRPKL